MIILNIEEDREFSIKDSVYIAPIRYFEVYDGPNNEVIELINSYIKKTIDGLCKNFIEGYKEQFNYKRCDIKYPFSLKIDFEIINNSNNNINYFLVLSMDNISIDNT